MMMSYVQTASGVSTAAGSDLYDAATEAIDQPMPLALEVALAVSMSTSCDDAP